MSIHRENWASERSDTPDPTYAKRELTVGRTDCPPGLCLAGEIDRTNVELVEQALRQHDGFDRTLHLDVSQLLFCDVSGIRAIVAYAEGLDADHRLLLHGLPAPIEKVMNVVGWSELPGIEFCTCDMET